MREPCTGELHPHGNDTQVAIGFFVGTWEGVGADATVRPHLHRASLSVVTAKIRLKKKECSYTPCRCRRRRKKWPRFGSLRISGRCSLLVEEAELQVKMVVEEVMDAGRVDKLRSWAGNKLAMMSGPVPMYVGEVHDKQCAAETEDWEGMDVQAVEAVTQCHRCGGWRHMERECPTSPGKSRGKGKDCGGYVGFKGNG